MHCINRPSAIPLDMAFYFRSFRLGIARAEGESSLLMRVLVRIPVIIVPLPLAG